MEDDRSKHDGDLDSLESIVTALRKRMRRSFEATDLSDEDEVLGVLLGSYASTMLALAEEAYDWGVVGPLDEFKEEAGTYANVYPELAWRIVPPLDDAIGAGLEDVVAAHFAARGYFVEQGVTERQSGDILELDILLTDYRQEHPQPTPIEVKSGEWGLPDMCKFYGWTRYLGLPPGQFFHKSAPTEEDKIAHLCDGTGIRLVQAQNATDLATQLEPLGLAEPHHPFDPKLWRFSYWVQGRLFRALQSGIRQQTCKESALAAKRFHRIVNDALFFEPDPRKRFARLLRAHFDHPKLAKSAAAELAGKGCDFDDPADTPQFEKALYRGHHLPVQACFYLQHRARLYVLKAAVDYWLADRRDKLGPEKCVLPVGETEFEVGDSSLTASFQDAFQTYSQYEWFPMLPTFWQSFLWTWGGFILTDRTEIEHEALSAETGVPFDDIPVALGAFDSFFPTEGGWLTTPSGTTRQLVKMMPAPLRGIGAFRRQVLYKAEDYRDLGFWDHTSKDLTREHNAAINAMECSESALGR